MECDIQKDPKFIAFVCEGYECNGILKFVKKSFPLCKVFLRNCDTKNFGSDTAFMKAWIMGGNFWYSESNVEIYLENNITVKLNGTDIMATKNFEPLPFQKSLTIPISQHLKVLKIDVCSSLQCIFEEEIDVTFEMIRARIISFTFIIDENRICWTKYSINKPLIKPQIPFKNPHLRNFHVKGLYKIPQKIEINNLNINAVGIDLGTTRCCAAVNRKNGIETVALDNTGERILPSFVSFDEKNIDKCGQLVVNRLQQNARSTIFDSKRIIGKKYSEVEIDKSWPFEVIDYKGYPVLELEAPYSLNGIIIKRPEEIAAILLKHIKQKCEVFQGKKLDEVVITVPAAFDESQKLSTLVAGKLAGWKAVHLLPEPVAAAIAYFIERPIPSSIKMILFDFGGGTLDVCIFSVTNDSLQIISQKGDNNLGGRNFDNLLFNHFSLLLNDQYNINVNVKDKLKYKLMLKCMEIKHTLTVENVASLDVSDFDTRVDKAFNITCQKFETMSSELLNKTRNIIDEALTASKYTARDINKVLFAGGSSRMPMIQQLLRKMFKIAEQCCEQNPDEVVAIGAAYYAYYLLESPPPIPRRQHSLRGHPKNFKWISHIHDYTQFAGLPWNVQE